MREPRAFPTRHRVFTVEAMGRLWEAKLEETVNNTRKRNHFKIVVILALWGDMPLVQ